MSSCAKLNLFLYTDQNNIPSYCLIFHHNKCNEWMDHIALYLMQVHDNLAIVVGMKLLFKKYQIIDFILNEINSTVV